MASPQVMEMETAVKQDEVVNKQEFCQEEIKSFVEKHFNNLYGGYRVIVKVISNNYFRINVLKLVEDNNRIVKSFSFHKSCMVHTVEANGDITINELPGN